MSSPREKHTEQASKPACLDVSPERLDAMSPSELADNMEQALDVMTEETYDPEVISAYLDALERKAPMPEPPDPQTAYQDFLQRLQKSVITAGRSDTRTGRRGGGVRRISHAGLAAAVVLVCLLASMAIAQAAGLDWLGTIALWTDNVFSFGTEQRMIESYNPTGQTESTGQADGSIQTAEDVPEEFRELQSELDQRSLPLYTPEIPKDFEAGDPLLYIDPETEALEFSISYTQNHDYIIFQIAQDGEQFDTFYEKDSSNLEIYAYNGITHYIFNNIDNTAAVWNIEDLEYSLFTNFSANEMKELIQTMY